MMKREITALILSAIMTLSPCISSGTVSVLAAENADSVSVEATAAETEESAAEGEESAVEAEAPVAVVEETGGEAEEATVEEIEAEAEAVASSANSDGKIDINTADEATLMTLPGIGQSKAGAIIKYRESNGPFAAPEDIKNISGIKEGTFNKIKDRITV